MALQRFTPQQCEDLKLFQLQKYAAPFVLRKLVQYGCKKQPTETYLEFIQNDDRECVKKWHRKEKEKLKEDNIDKYDVTFLVPLISAACAGVAFPGTKEHNIQLKNPDSLENLIKQTKDLRNAIVHDDLPQRRNMVSEAKSILPKVLQVAFTQFGIDPRDLAKEEAALNVIFDDIERSGPDYIINTYKREGREEFNSNWDTTNFKYLLFGKHHVSLNRLQTFYKINLSVGNAKNKEIFPCTELFEKVKSKVKVITGYPGSGKTTFSKVLVDVWLQKPGNLKISNLDMYDMIVHIDCKSNSVCTLPEAVKEQYPTTFSCLPKKSVKKALPYLNILWLLDGYDEATEQSKELLIEAANKCNTNANMSLIVSARQHYSDDLTAVLGRIVNYEEALIEPITAPPDQLKFLLCYQTHMSGSSNKLTQAFGRLSPDMKLILSHPFLLTAFCFLYEKDEKAAEEIKTELEIFEGIREHTEKEMENSIHCDVPGKSSTIANQLQENIYKLCMQLILRQSYYLNEDEYKAFVSKLCKEFGPISYDNVLSNILSKSSANNASIYSFVHTTYQEYQGALYIVREISNLDSEHSIESILEKLAGGKKCLRRSLGLRQVMRFVTLKLHRNRNLRPHMEELCQLFKDMNPDFRFCTDIISATGHDQHFIKLLSSVVVDHRFTLKVPVAKPSLRYEDRPASGWFIHQQSMMLPAAGLLKHRQPSMMVINAVNEAQTVGPDLETLMKSIKDNFKGKFTLQFTHSRNTFTPVDSAVQLLNNSSVQLVWFKACVKELKTLQLVSRLMNKRGEYMHVALKEATEEKLNAVYGIKSERLVIRLLFCDLQHLTCLATDQLRAKHFGYLILEVPCGGSAAVLSFLLKCNPKLKKYFVLALPRCSMDDRDLSELVSKLQRSGVRTEWNDEPDDTRWINVTKIKDDGTCYFCQVRHESLQRCIFLNIPDIPLPRSEPSNCL